MILDDYLKDEFNVYPNIFRGIVNFIPKESIRNEIEKISFNMECNQCNATPKLIKRKNSTNYRVRYRVECGCGQKSGYCNYPYQAVWSWQGKKEATQNNINPLVDMKLYTEKKELWRNSLGEKNTIWDILSFMSAIQFYRKVWSIHKTTLSYKELVSIDKSFIDTIGLLINLLRKDVVAFISSVGLDLSSSDVQVAILLNEQACQQDRLKHFSKYSDKLPLDFSIKIKTLLSKDIK